MNKLDRPNRHRSSCWRRTKSTDDLIWFDLIWYDLMLIWFKYSNVGDQVIIYRLRSVVVDVADVDKDANNAEELHWLNGDVHAQ